MDNLLIDRETLGRFVDELIKKKPLAVNNPEELNALREESIKNLDDRIALAIFGGLNEQQNAELNQLLDRPDTSETEFQQFFEKNGLNVEEAVANTVRVFGREFLGGENAWES